MDINLLLGTILIILALIFYTTGVWSEKIQGLRRIHVILFFSGLTFDFLGTMFMVAISDNSSFNLHMVTGPAALLLMLAHAIWAYLVLRRGDKDQLLSFHKYSIVVWLFWLIPFVSGIVLAMK